MREGLTPRLENGFSTFARSARSTRRTSATQQVSRKRSKILIVDDDPALQRAMRRHLHMMPIDADVVVASHYAAARAHLASGTPDLACIDICLPTESGYELCEFIRGPLGLVSLPILVLSPLGSPRG